MKDTQNSDRTAVFWRAEEILKSSDHYPVQLNAFTNTHDVLMKNMKEDIVSVDSVKLE